MFISKLFEWKNIKMHIFIFVILKATKLNLVRLYRQRCFQEIVQDRQGLQDLVQAVDLKWYMYYVRTYVYLISDTNIDKKNWNTI